MRSQKLSYPILSIYVQYMCDRYQLEVGIVPLDLSTLPEIVSVEYANQNKLLYKAIYGL